MTDEADPKPLNNAYPGFLAQEEDRSSYMLQQYFIVEDSRGAPIKQLELRSYVSLAPLIHGRAQNGEARTQWMAWEDGFLEWVSTQRNISNKFDMISHDLRSRAWSSTCGIFSWKALRFDKIFTRSRCSTFAKVLKIN
jgi:hypothetical protein